MIFGGESMPIFIVSSASSLLSDVVYFNFNSLSLFASSLSVSSTKPGFYPAVIK